MNSKNSNLSERVCISNMHLKFQQNYLLLRRIVTSDRRDDSPQMILKSGLSTKVQCFDLQARERRISLKEYYQQLDRLNESIVRNPLIVEMACVITTT